MPTIRQIATQEGVTKMAIYNRIKAISHSLPNFMHKYTRVDADHNNTILISDKGADIIEDYAHKRNSHKQSSRKSDDNYTSSEKQSSGNNKDSAKLIVLKMKLSNYEQLLKSKDLSIQDKVRDIRDKKEEINQVHRDLDRTQQLLKREQDIGMSRSHRYELRIKHLNNKIKALPKPSKSPNSSHRSSKQSFWSRLFGK